MPAVHISSGQLNRRVSLQGFTQTQDDVGQPVRVWSEIAKLFVRIRTIKFARSVVADGIQVELTHEVRMRHREGVTPDMRLVYGGRVFMVHVVDDVEEAHVALDLFCSEGTRET